MTENSQTQNVLIEKQEKFNELNDWKRYLGALGSMLKSRMFTQRPFFLAHAMTFGCNSRCKTCTYWKNIYRMKEDMKTEEVYQLLDEAYEAGMRGYYMFGGEPLISPDIDKITDYAENKGFITVMNTNGSLLEEKGKKLKNLDFAFVSLDYYNDYDDVIRGRPNTFGEVIRGVYELKKIGRTKVAFVTTISSIVIVIIKGYKRKVKVFQLFSLLFQQ